jgi:uncharacterized protein
MSPLHALAIFAAGLAAGTVNVIVGSGSLITFPTLLALGYPPVLANVSNTVGLAPGNASAVVAYRRELVGQRPRLIQLGSASLVGALVGAVLLLALPHSVFKAAVPVLIALAALLMAVQPRMRAALEQRGTRAVHGGVPLIAGVFFTGIYGGYFGAAQGVLVIGLLGTFLDETMQRINGAKNVLVGTVNGSAAIVYIIFAHVNWLVVLLIAVGSTIGGLLGARIGRRLPPLALRIFIVVIGLISSIRLIFF